jgi:hypothetical protein
MLGAYFQCFKNPFATYKALESFRQHYPKAPILLLSDNGYNYSKMAEHFNCKYIHSNVSSPYIINYENDDEKYRESAHKLVQRFLNAFEDEYFVDCKYIMLLEDDVKVHEKIDERLLEQGADLFGNNPNSFDKNLIREIKALDKSYDHLDENGDYRWSGHGGSLYKRETFIKYCKNKKIVEEVIDACVKLRGTYFSTNICQDMMFSLILIVSGGKIKKLYGHDDSLSLYEKKCFVQHQFKYYYNQPLPKELEHLVEL